MARHSSVEELIERWALRPARPFFKRLRPVHGRARGARGWFARRAENLECRIFEGAHEIQGRVCGTVIRLSSRSMPMMR